MRTGIATIELGEAIELAEYLVDTASEDGLKPVAICIVDAFGMQLCAVTMPGTKEPSIATAHAKAVTAIKFERNTILFHLYQPSENPGTDDYWAAGETWHKDPNDWTDLDVTQAMKINPVFCSWGGGVLIRSPHDNAIIGAVGVSNRSEIEDHELASQRPSGWSA